MSSTAASTHTSAASFLARRPVWQISYLSGLAASVAVETWGLAARAAGVPMRAAGFGSHHATPITVGMFAMGTMVITFWFTFAVILMARFAKNPKRTYCIRRCRCSPSPSPCRSQQPTRRSRPRSRSPPHT